MEKKGRYRVLVYAGLLIAMASWSLSFIWLKMVYRFIEPITATFLRQVATSVILLAAAKFTKRLQRIKREDWKFVILLTFFHPFAYFLSESFGIKFSSPTTAAVIVSTIPLLIPVASVYFLNERLSKMNVVGMLVSFTGVLLVIVKPDFSISGSPLGILLLFAAVISGVAFTTSLKKLSFKYNAFTLVTYQNLLGILWFAPLFVIFDLEHFLTVRFTMELIVPLSLLVVFASVLAFLFYTAAVKELGASRAGIFGNSIPVFTAVFSWLLLSETLTLQKMAGIFLVIAGLFLSQARKRTKYNV
jgi:drug/metabolite transporter (DMT)-like permease